MVLSSWFALFRGRVCFLVRKPQRRLQRAGRWLSDAPELFETRALLSAVPAVTFLPSGPIDYTEASGPIVLPLNATVTSADLPPSFSGGTLTESISLNGTTQDQLTINHQGTAAGQIGVSGSDVTYGGTIIGSFTGGSNLTPLVVTLNANATLEAVQALQNNIAYELIGDPTSTVSRTFTSVIVDAEGDASAPANATINILQANPELTLTTTNLTVKTSSPVAIDPGITLTSPPASSLEGAVLTVSLTDGTSRDELGILNHGRSKRAIKVSGSDLQLRGVTVGRFSGGVGTTPLTITFNAEATLEDVQQVARSITFRSIGHFAHETAVEFGFSDGQGGISEATTATITVTKGGKSKGPKGPKGPNVTDGTDGSEGTDGPKGTKGQNGPKGPKGPKG